MDNPATPPPAPAAACPACPAPPVCATLPSARSAYDVLCGAPGAPLRLLRDLAGRAALVAVGVAAAGERDPRKIVAYGLGGAVAIEVAVLAYVYATTPRGGAAR